jgi:hypothetical protein
MTRQAKRPQVAPEDEVAYVTASFLSGSPVRRSYATTAEAIEAAEEVARGPTTRTWNPNGALVHPVGGGRGWWVR